MPVASSRKQVNLRVDERLYETLEVLARQERRSVNQTARMLLEEGLRHRTDGNTRQDDTPGVEIAVLANVGGSFDWLANEPDLYDDSSGAPV